MITVAGNEYVIVPDEPDYKTTIYDKGGNVVQELENILLSPLVYVGSYDKYYHLLKINVTNDDHPFLEFWKMDKETGETFLANTYTFQTDMYGEPIGLLQTHGIGQFYNNYITKIPTGEIFCVFPIENSSGIFIDYHLLKYDSTADNYIEKKLLGGEKEYVTTEISDDLFPIFVGSYYYPLDDWKFRDEYKSLRRKGPFYQVVMFSVGTRKQIFCKTFYLGRPPIIYNEENVENSVARMDRMSNVVIGNKGYFLAGSEENTEIFVFTPTAVTWDSLHYYMRSWWFGYNSGYIGGDIFEGSTIYSTFMFQGPNNILIQDLFEGEDYYIQFWDAGNYFKYYGTKNAAELIKKDGGFDNLKPTLTKKVFIDKSDNVIYFAPSILWQNPKAFVGASGILLAYNSFSDPQSKIWFIKYDGTKIPVGGADYPIGDIIWFNNHIYYSRVRPFGVVAV